MRNGLRNMVACGAAGALMLVGTGAGVIAVGGGVVEDSGAAISTLGPPIICHPYEIGDCETLEWGNSALTGKRGYDRKKLVVQTVGFLDKQDAAIERMETIRRAAIYVDGDRQLGLELLSRLSWRAMDAEARGHGSAAAWFDAAFLVACFEEVGPKVIGKAGESNGVAAFAWMEHALALDRRDGKIDAGLELGAALMVHPILRGQGDGLYSFHLAAALDSAGERSLEARNISAEIKRWDKTPTSIRRAAKRYDDRRGD